MVEKINFIELEILDPMLKARWGKLRSLPAVTAHVLIKQRKAVKIKTESAKTKENSLQKESFTYNNNIPVFIPWADDKNIGKSYNKIMNIIDEWVLFIDHDILLVNPLWHTICKRAIDKVGKNAGWITCFTNRIYCKAQLYSGADNASDDIRYHRDIARSIYIKNERKILDISNRKEQLSGFFILTNKEAWKKAGGFKKEGFFTVDNQYSTDLKRAGYKLYLMADLYVYHSYFRDSVNNSFERSVRCERD